MLVLTSAKLVDSVAVAPETVSRRSIAPFSLPVRLPTEEETVLSLSLVVNS